MAPSWIDVEQSGQIGVPLSPRLFVRKPSFYSSGTAMDQAANGAPPHRALLKARPRSASRRLACILTCGPRTIAIRHQFRGIPLGVFAGATLNSHNSVDPLAGPSLFTDF